MTVVHLLRSPFSFPESIPTAVGSDGAADLEVCLGSHMFGLVWPNC